MTRDGRGTNPRVVEAAGRAVAAGPLHAARAAGRVRRHRTDRAERFGADGTGPAVSVAAPGAGNGGDESTRAGAGLPRRRPDPAAARRGPRVVIDREYDGYPSGQPRGAGA